MLATDSSQSAAKTRRQSMTADIQPGVTGVQNNPFACGTDGHAWLLGLTPDRRFPLLATSGRPELVLPQPG
jgi:hypothetical protein